MKKILCISIFSLFLIAALASSSLAANSTSISSDGSKVSIILDGSTDWNGATDGQMPRGRGLIAIKFFPSAANDVLVVRDGSATGPEIFHGKDVPGGGLADGTFGGLVSYPYIHASDCTLGTPANARVIMIFSPIPR